jgi:hypothetical protein
MNEKGPHERFRPVSDPAKGEAAEDRGESLHFGFSDVRQSKRDGLQPQRLGTKFARVPKQDPASKNEFPADQVEECCPG